MPSCRKVFGRRRCELARTSDSVTDEEVNEVVREALENSILCKRLETNHPQAVSFDELPMSDRRVLYEAIKAMESGDVKEW